MSDSFLELLGKMVIYGGGVATVAVLVFQFLGKSWIENKFAQRLEQHKHNLALEIQRLRVEIDSMLSGAIKLQEKEFETLPEAWRILDEAHGLVSALSSPFQSYPDLDGMTPARLEEFLKTTELFDTQKDDIRQSNEKVRTYQQVIFWHRLASVKRGCIELRNYVARYGIFFPLELKEQFTKFSDELWAVLSYTAVGHEVKSMEIQTKALDKLRSDIEPLYKAIESNIHARLHSHGRSG